MLKVKDKRENLEGSERKFTHYIIYRRLQYNNKLTSGIIEARRH